MASAPEFGLYVRVKKGHAVPRYGTNELLAARRVTLSSEDKLAGKSPVEWTDRIVPLTNEYCRRYKRALEGHLRNGELVKCTREAWLEQAAADDKAAEKAKRDKAQRLKKAAEAAKSSPQADASSTAEKAEKADK